MRARKNLRRITPPSVFSNEGGRQVCSNLWAGFMMRRLDREDRIRYESAGFIRDGVVTWLYGPLTD